MLGRRSVILLACHSSSRTCDCITVNETRVFDQDPRVWPSWFNSLS